MAPVSSPPPAVPGAAGRPSLAPAVPLWRRPLTWLLLLCAAAALLFFPGLTHRGLTDNEGMYAEIGREILLTGDWITTHINGDVYLNKPPLMFWLIALGYRLVGTTEAVRFLAGIATLLILPVLYDTGRVLWRPSAGVWAAAVFLSSMLTTVEARILRVDVWTALFVAVSLWGAVRVARSDGERPDALGLWGLWLGAGIGVMLKGLIGVVLPALALVPALLVTRRWRDVPRYCPLWGLLVLAGVVLPWHILAGLQNKGFWWDYIVNQHLLFFFDRKFPRDSEPDSLAEVWGVFAARLFPWLLFLPAAVMRQVRRIRTTPSVAEWIPLLWPGMIFLFFSASKGRLEHHLIPAVPGAALLIGGLVDEWAHPRKRGAETRGQLLPFALLLAIGLGGLVVGPYVLRTTRAIHAAPQLLSLATGAMLCITAAGAAGMSAMKLRRPAWAMGGVAGCFLVFAYFSLIGLDLSDGYISPRPLIRSVPPTVWSSSRVAYEVSEEYQLCGVFNFYLGPRIDLVEPPGFIPPTYLKQDVSHLFVKRGPFWSEWAGPRRILLFTDPKKPLDRAGEYPQPFYEVGRDGRRQLITNQPITWR